MQNRQEMIDNINNFMRLCKTNKGEVVPEEYTYQDISKVVAERYPTQSVEVVKIYFSTKGSQRNNIPYRFEEELPVGTATLISDDLYAVRTSTQNIYGSTKKGSM